MEVPDALSGALAVVHHHPVGVRVTGIGRDAPHDLQEPSAEALVLEIRELRDVEARHDEHMERRGRVAIGEGDRVVVLIDERRGDLAGDDAAEHAVVHGS